MPDIFGLDASCNNSNYVKLVATGWFTSSMFAAAIKNTVIVILIVLIAHFLIRQALNERAAHLPPPVKSQVDQDNSDSGSDQGQDQSEVQTQSSSKVPEPFEEPQEPAAPPPKHDYKKKRPCKGPKEEELYRFVFATAQPADTLRLEQTPAKAVVGNGVSDGVFGDSLLAYPLDQPMMDYCEFTPV